MSFNSFAEYPPAPNPETKKKDVIWFVINDDRPFACFAVMNARKTRILAAKVMGASRTRVLFDLMLLESVPQTFVGLRNGVSLALVIIVVAEMFIGSQDGLGHSVFEAQQLFDMPRMYAAIFAAGALGYGLNLLFLLAERSFVHWGGR